MYSLNNRKESIMNRYPVGTRVMLLRLVNYDYSFKEGLTGTVVGYNDNPSLLVDWDNGKSNVISPYDGDWVERISG